MSMSARQEDFVKNEFKRISHSVMKRYIDEKMCVPCEDRLIGVISGEASVLVEGVDMSNERDRILLVLESPHICEYEASPPRAASGETGRNIFNFANQVFSLYDGWGLWVINAIEYPCSLLQNISKTGKDIRDTVLSEMWKLNEVRESFERRLKKHCGSGRNLIVEASGSKTLRDGIRCIVDCLEVDKRFVPDVPHPRSWLNPKAMDKAKLLVCKERMYYGLHTRNDGDLAGSKASE